MIIDYRVYCTLYLLCFIIYAASILFTGNDRWFDRLFIGGPVGAILIGSVHYLDWLWA